MPNDNNIQPLAIDANYPQWLQQLKERYRQAQIKAASRVNEELLRYYWQLGADIDARGDENQYGTGFFEMLSRDLKELLPNAEGLSASNLKFAVRFYKMYAVEPKGNREQPVLESSQPNRQQLVNELTSESQIQNRQQLVSKSQDEDCTPNRQQLVNELTSESQIQNRQQLVSKMEHTPDDAIFRIPWGHHIVILGKCANNKEMW